MLRRPTTESSIDVVAVDFFNKSRSTLMSYKKKQYWYITGRSPHYQWRSWRDLKPRAT
jgi:hypothetical protein